MTAKLEVSYKFYGEFLDLPDLPPILSVERDDWRQRLTVRLDDGLPFEWDAHMLITEHYEEGPMRRTWLLRPEPEPAPFVPLRYASNGAPPDWLRPLLAPPWGPNATT